MTRPIAAEAQVYREMKYRGISTILGEARRLGERQAMPETYSQKNKRK